MIPLLQPIPVKLGAHLMFLKAEQSDKDFIYALLVSIEPKLYKAFMEAVNQLRDEALIEQLAQLLRSGDLDSALALIQRTIGNFATDVVGLYFLAGTSAAASISNMLKVRVGFDQTNYRAVQMMQSARLRLIQGLVEDQRNALRTSLTSGITRGINPKQQALELTRILGLNSRQVEAIDNYRRLLEMGSSAALSRELRDARSDRTVERAIRTGNGLTNDQIERMVSRYAKNQLVYRAQMVARTESLRAVHQAADEAFMQAIDDGAIDKNDLKRKWVTAHDERVRSSHSSMDGQIKGMDEPFISGDGYSLRYPGDYNAPASEVINCRCVVVTKFKE